MFSGIKIYYISFSYVKCVIIPLIASNFVEMLHYSVQTKEKKHGAANSIVTPKPLLKTLLFPHYEL